jgi:hypothetical protein
MVFPHTSTKQPLCICLSQQYVTNILKYQLFLPISCHFVIHDQARINTMATVDRTPRLVHYTVMCREHDEA